MVEDRIKLIDGSRLQFGALSDRVYLMHLAPGDAKTIVLAMEQLAKKNGYTKLFAKIPCKHAAPFTDRGFEVEAHIPDFYPDGDTALFLSHFLSASRRVPTDAKHLHEVLKKAKQRKNTGVQSQLPSACNLSVMGTGNAEQMADLYRRVFDSYPFPIFDPLYLRQAMKKNINYVGIAKGGSLLALAAAETDDGGVEMTDFATDPAYRGICLAGHLLSAMESNSRENGVKTAFTIARAASYGINILFARAGYVFAGTLINNTNISGRVQSMNVWYKPLLSNAEAPLLHKMADPV